jgi:hypothetical protein
MTVYSLLNTYPYIIPGEIKVDLANFDVKFPTKFVCPDEKKLLFRQMCLLNLFELLT